MKNIKAKKCSINFLSINAMNYFFQLEIGTIFILIFEISIYNLLLTILEKLMIK